MATVITASEGIVLITVLSTLVTFTVVIVGGWWGIRRLSRHLEHLAGTVPRTNLFELFFMLKSWSWREILLTLQRSETGKGAQHPMGSVVTDTPWLDQLAFDPVTLDPSPPVPKDISLRVTIGPRAKKPLVLELPVLVAPMGYGVGLTAAAKTALAQVAALAGTATSSGEGPFLPEERAYAHKWILQWSQGPWNHQKEVVRLADMVEIHLGQGAEGQIHISRHKHLPRRLKRMVQGKSVVIRGGTPPLPYLFTHLKRINPDIPIGVKLIASNHIEKDLQILMRWPVDVITVDGQEAASQNSPAVISDHFGIPTVWAVIRARRWLKRHHIHHITLIASGGVKGAADIAKLIALGADAVALGSPLLLAVSHEQLSKFLPLSWHGPNRLVFADHSSHIAARFDVGQAVHHAVNWFTSTADELRTILEALGLDKVAALNPGLLIAKTENAAPLLAVSRLEVPFLVTQLAGLTDSYKELNHCLLEQYRLLRTQKERISGA